MCTIRVYVWHCPNNKEQVPYKLVTIILHVSPARPDWKQAWEHNLLEDLKGEHLLWSFLNFYVQLILLLNVRTHIGNIDKVFQERK